MAKSVSRIGSAIYQYRTIQPPDGDTRVPVMYGDRTGHDISDDEVEEGVKDEDDDSEAQLMAGNIPTPDSLASQSMSQSQHLQQDADSNSMFLPTARPMPLRYHTQPTLDEHPAFPGNSYRNVGFQSQSPNPQDLGRRSFGSPVYPSPQGIYGWQHNMVSNGTMPPSFYVTSNNLGPQNGQFQLPLPPTAPPPMLPPMVQNNFDGMPVRQFDSGPALGNQLRTGSLGHPHHMPAGFQEYLQENGPYSHNDSEVRNDQHHHQ
jgi:hypothetical protein